MITGKERKTVKDMNYSGTYFFKCLQIKVNMFEAFDKRRSTPASIAEFKLHFSIIYKL